MDKAIDRLEDGFEFVFILFSHVWSCTRARTPVITCNAFFDCIYAFVFVFT